MQQRERENKSTEKKEKEKEMKNSGVCIRIERSTLEQAVYVRLVKDNLQVV
jgi:hypothetical protein